MLPVTREIIAGGCGYSALDVYRAQYELAALRRAADAELRTIDVLVLPTASPIYETAAVAADPKRLNTNLGFYTSFVNLLDLAAIALPAGFRANGLPFGISLIAPAHSDSALLGLGVHFLEIASLPLGTAKV
jgi:allophanate hydrolase